MSAPRPRVFVSSVVDGFKEFREAARRAIQRAGGDPVLVNEDHPATGESPRNACLDAVESCDLYVMLVGSRGGWTAPSGQLVVEEEYHHARKHKLPTLIFIQDIDRDAEGDRLVKSVSGFTAGAFRQTFGSTTDLEQQVEKAIQRESKIMSRALTSPQLVSDKLVARARSRNDPILRFVLVPERREEVISPMELESVDFMQAVYAIGHAGGRPLFSYARPKDGHVERNTLVIEQTDPNGRHDSTQLVLLKIDENGLIEVEANVTNRRGGNAFAGSMVVLADDISDVLQSMFGFLAGLFDRIDPNRRQQRFLYGVALLELGHRNITRDASPKSSYTMAMRNDETVLAFDEPRPLSRDDLSAPANEITRALTLLERGARQ